MVYLILPITEKVKQIESESQSQSSRSVREDAISQVLGEERPGRARALGRGVNHINCRLLPVRDTQAAQFRTRMSELKEEVRMLKKNQICTANDHDLNIS